MVRRSPRRPLLLAKFALCALLASLASGCLYTPRVDLGDAVVLDGSQAGSDPVATDAAAFFRDPSLAKAAISPDGRHVAGIRSKEGVQAILSIAIDSGEVDSLGAIQIDGGDRLRHFSKLGWASASKLLASVESRLAYSGALKPRKTRLFLAELGKDRPRYLGPRLDPDDPADVIERWQQFEDDIIHWLPRDPDAVVVDFKGRAKRFDLRTSRYTKVRGSYMAERIAVQWLADHRGAVRAAYGTRGWGTRYLLFARRAEVEAFEKLAEFDMLSEKGILFAGFSEDPNRIYVFADNDEGRTALREYTLPEGPLGPEIVSLPDYDLRRLRSSPADGHLIAVEYDAKKPESHYLDAAWERTQNAVDAALPKRVNRFISMDVDETRAVVDSAGPQSPPRLYVVDRRDDSVEELLENYPEVDRRRLSPMRPVEYRARDGSRIPAYLTVPRGRDPAQLPVVVLVHGGPSDRVVWGWDPLVQFLASRGFAVFQPNFRGSAGYGRAYREAAHRRWGQEPQSDISDGVRWLIERGVADPERIGIYGTGYGGYAALLEAARVPDLYAAAASYGAMTDLIETLADEARGYGGSPDWNRRMIGDRSSAEDRLRLAAVSPRRLVDRIRAPILLGHGEDDPSVSVDQLEKMAAALGKREPKPEVYVYAGELDSFIDERARIDFHTRLGRFFERHLR